MATPTQRMAIRRGSADALALPPFPASILVREPRLAAELEEWRRAAQQNLDHTISALKLDTASVRAGLATEAALTAAVATLTAAIALKVNKAGDTMTGQLLLPQIPDSEEAAASKYYVDNA